MVITAAVVAENFDLVFAATFTRNASSRINAGAPSKSDDSRRRSSKGGKRSNVVQIAALDMARNDLTYRQGHHVNRSESVEKSKNRKTTMTISQSEWLTPAEGAQYLKVKPRTILLWVRQGKLKAYPLSGIKRRVWRLRREDLDAALMASPVLPSIPLSVRSPEGRIS
jgi:excisionase family DNA binding protein